MAGQTDRREWTDTMARIVAPVLESLARRELRRDMPVEQKTAGREAYTYLEAFGRVLTGAAPWLELGEDDTQEGTQRGRFAQLARAGLDAATDPGSPDRMNFAQGDQPIVDAAFLAQGLLRAPHQLIDRLDERVRRNLIECLRQTRVGRKPYYCNWLLFSAVIEAALRRLGAEWDHMRVDYAIRQIDQWYCGDGMYSDGPEYHQDYYNSFVIQPMLLDLLDAVGGCYDEWARLREPARARSRRYAAILERSVSPEGTFPPVGRSICYRFGVFQTLGQMALRHDLPEGVAPAQVRGALTAVIRRIMACPNFDAGGWLRIGVCGSQPSLGEGYISTGSLYLCTVGLLPLGLPETDPFWCDPDAPWSAVKFWGGQDMPADHAV